jgi:hypothetical protein
MTMTPLIILLVTVLIDAGLLVGMLRDLNAQDQDMLNLLVPPTSYAGAGHGEARLS